MATCHLGVSRLAFDCSLISLLLLPNTLADGRSCNRWRSSHNDEQAKD
jgi:hypothetical protein